ncbi:hypothetical protein L873DRAFT_1813815 [Choiromyces venosus 120613-1]|uniref:Uncharacterized protein n=1 Tax=Choiromyces venosus 120613-1 TaxID=1336337 RepID=A0A3N4J963_9PEZI|nr:hypothetical protein L873DRAFT_1813815 [Choiromyces venosus 120613-1]
MPGLEAQQLRTRVVQAICHEYIEHQRSHNRLRSASDSTDASSQGAQVPTRSGSKEIADSDASAWALLFYGSEAS